MKYLRFIIQIFKVFLMKYVRFINEILKVFLMKYSRYLNDLPGGVLFTTRCGHIMDTFIMTVLELSRFICSAIFLITSNDYLSNC